MLKAVFFDHDGTLVDSEHEHYLIWEKILKNYHVRFDADEYEKDFSGMPTDANAILLVERYRLDVNAERLAAEKRALTMESLALGPYPLMHWAREAMAFFHRHGLTVAVVSGSDHGSIDHTVHGHDMKQFLSTIVSCEDVARSKPDPACYELALHRLGLRADEAIAIEDTEHGIRSAVGAGIQCCGVRNKFSKNHDFSLAIREFSHLEEASLWIASNYAIPSLTTRANEA